MHALQSTVISWIRPVLDDFDWHKTMCVLLCSEDSDQQAKNLIDKLLQSICFDMIKPSSYWIVRLTPYAIQFDSQSFAFDPNFDFVTLFPKEDEEDNTKTT